MPSYRLAGPPLTMRAASRGPTPSARARGALSWETMARVSSWAGTAERMAKASLGKDDPLHKDKLMCARYWMERMVPECPMLLERIQAGSAVVMELD